MTRRGYVGLLAALVVVAALGFGLRAIGTPGEARLHRLDSRRVESLDAVSRAVDEYYRRYKRLPTELGALSEFSNVSIQDPETQEPFGYRITSDRHYQLCATFARQTPREEGTTYWWHDAGRQCYGLAPRDTPR